jgi:hypothetical protein
MDKGRTVKRVTVETNCSKGDWLTKCKMDGDVRADLRKMTQNWSKMVMEREAWKRIVEQVKICRVQERKKTQNH